MLNQEDELLLADAKHEITSLRNRNAIQSARLSMFDDMMMLFTSYPPSTGASCCEDIAWNIEKRLEQNKLEKQTVSQ